MGCNLRLPVCKRHQRKGRSRLATSLLRTRPIFADLCIRCAAVPRLCPSSPPVSSVCVSIMVDILMLMFFAIVGLVFLSYIIYLLWCSSSEPLSRTHRMRAFPVQPHWFQAWATVRKRFLSLIFFSQPWLFVLFWNEKAKIYLWLHRCVKPLCPL